jgi:DNA-binding NarL/FixJ family response regulator
MGYRNPGAFPVLPDAVEALACSGDQAAAAVLLARLGREAEAVGSPWARAAEELERAAPGRARGELTPAERRIAALVAEGKRNREIGQTLFMSVATVEAHLTRTYRKLGIRSRSELARRMTDGSL